MVGASSNPEGVERYFGARVLPFAPRNNDVVKPEHHDPSLQRRDVVSRPSLALNLDQALIKAWVAKHLPVPSLAEEFPLSAAIGVSRGTEIVAGFLYDRFDNIDCEVTAAVKDRAFWVRRDLIHACFAYPFLQLDCSRMSCTVSADDHKASKLASKLGFKLEGVKRKAYAGLKDARIYGMLREECRWLR